MNNAIVEATKVPAAIAPTETHNHWQNAPHGVQIANVEHLNLDLSGSINAIDALLSKIPRPRMEPPPKEEQDYEEPYIHELCCAYGSKDNQTYPNSASLPTEHQTDLSKRRVDYFAAESIRKGVCELNDKSLHGQFEVLKEEMLETVSDIPKRSHSNGYDCMLDVMNQAARAPLEEYLLAHTIGWISKRVRKGVCHFLVNEGSLKWVD